MENVDMKTFLVLELTPKLFCVIKHFYSDHFKISLKEVNGTQY